MKKRIGIVLLVCFSAVILLPILLVFVIAPGINAINLSGLVNDFLDEISEHSQTPVCETKSVYGKLNGNGNGIQYFGACLVKAESAEALEAVASELEQKFEYVGFWQQEDDDIESKYLEHRSLEYDTHISDGEKYFTICFFNSQHPNSCHFDLAGH